MTQDNDKLEAALDRVKQGYAQFDTFGTCHAVLYSEQHESDLNIVLQAAKNWHELKRLILEEGLEAREALLQTTEKG